MRQLGAVLPDFQQLVDLLLIFHHAEFHIGVVDWKDALGPHRVLIKRDRDRAQSLGRQHRGIQPRAVGTYDHQMIAPRETHLVQAAGQLLHHGGQVGPGQGLPNAIFFLAHGRRGGPLLGML